MASFVQTRKIDLSASVVLMLSLFERSKDHGSSVIVQLRERLSGKGKFGSGMLKENIIIIAGRND